MTVPRPGATVRWAPYDSTDRGKQYAACDECAWRGGTFRDPGTVLAQWRAHNNEFHNNKEKG